METRKVRIEVDVTMEITPEDLEYGVTGGAEGEAAIEEAISYAVQEIEYSFNSNEPGIKVISTNLVSYN